MIKPAPEGASIVSSLDSSRWEGKRQAVLVLGMHRSGTSALASVIARLGAALPKTQTRSTLFNAKGYGESYAINQFNDGLLASTGSNWRDFEPFDPHWMQSPFAPSYAREARRLIQSEFGDASIIVMKDPRICRILPFWLEQLRALEFETHAVLSVRNPLEVAASLERRDGMPPRIALLLWLRHVLDAEAETRGLSRAWIKYDELLSDWRGVMGRLGRKLELSWLSGNSDAEREIDDFLTSELRHHSTSQDEIDRRADVSDWVKTTYKVTSSHSDMEIEPAGRETLDQVRGSLNAASEAFRPLIATELRRSLGDVEILSRALAQAQHSNTKLSDRLAASKQKLDDYKRMIGPISKLLALGASLSERIRAATEHGREKDVPNVEKSAVPVTSSRHLEDKPVANPGHNDSPSAGKDTESSTDFEPDPQIAVICHVYYLSLWEELSRQIQQIPAAFDLYVTIVDQPGALELSEHIRSENPQARIEIIENHGRDIFPFLSTLNSGALDKYYLICKLHTKKSPHREDGDAWRRRIFFNLLDSPENVADIIRGFNANPELGLVVADGELYEGEKGWKRNRERCDELVRGLGIRLDDYPPRFAFASIFWARGNALKTLRGLALTSQSFEPEQGQVDGTTTHAIERLFSILTMADGLKVVERSRI
jgi:hypothetical protein